MGRVLVAYGSTEGQTAAIADRIGDVLADAGHDPLVISTKHPPPEIDIARYDGVVVAASVHMGDHQPDAVSFVRENLDALERIPSAFVSVSLTAATDSEDADRTTNEYVQDVLQETGWSPTRTHIVAGALKYREYGLLTRFVVRRIAGKEGLATDTSRDHEYTDWDDIEAFAGEFATLVDDHSSNAS
ncbi:flavodoxin domain-containing protein [Natronosalvus halobius]|uniref:flavodoxin domain-containing protein n=1 Tax=Natronosalvus halobius TaxID=2953746 RepID=UPI00209EA756|nr:flavodoxin domain-containing protein [Natronosalvus halobius]USZ70888.1 protoporphyrinogen oxidase [Natronosalvus halobius]